MSAPYREAAAYYARGRPPYSDAFVPCLVKLLGLDGTGRMLDVGCGPGVLARSFHGRFVEIIGLDPEPAMLDEAARERPSGEIRWINARAEDIPDLDLGTFQLVTFGQSYHWTDRAQTAEIVYAVIEPGGAMAVVNHVPAEEKPEGPGWPPIPHEDITAVLAHFGIERRRKEPPPPRHEVALAASSFGPPERIVLPGRADLVRTVEDILAGLYSTSFAAPNRFGNRRGEFENQLRNVLARHSPDGLFWEWPGDTEVLLARR